MNILNDISELVLKDYANMHIYELCMYRKELSEIDKNIDKPIVIIDDNKVYFNRVEEPELVSKFEYKNNINTFVFTNDISLYCQHILNKALQNEKVKISIINYQKIHQFLRDISQLISKRFVEYLTVIFKNTNIVIIDNKTIIKNRDDWYYFEDSGVGYSSLNVLVSYHYTYNHTAIMDYTRRDYKLTEFIDAKTF